MTDTDPHDLQPEADEAAAFDARMRESLDLGPDGSSPADVLAEPHDAGPSIAASDVRRPALPERASYADDAGDPAEQEAWTALVAAHAELLEVVEEIEDLPTRQRAEQDAYEAQVAAAVRDGRTMPRRPKDGAWEWQARELLGRYRGLRARFDGARTAYNAARRAALPSQAKRLAERIEPARAAALEALEQIAALLPVVNGARGAIATAEAALHDAGHKVPAVYPRRETPPANGLGAALADTVAALSSADPFYTGSYLLVEEGFEPSSFEREQWFRSGGEALVLLQQLEMREQYRHTSFTRDLSRAQFQTLSTDRPRTFV